MRRLARLLATAAAVAAVASAPSVQGQPPSDIDAVLRALLREESRSGGNEEKIRNLAAARPSLAYLAALDLCASGIAARAAGGDFATPFDRAGRIARAMRPGAQHEALQELIALYRSYEAPAARQWIGAQGHVGEASRLIEAGQRAAALEHVLAAARAGAALDDPLLLAESRRIGGIIARTGNQLEEARKLTEFALGMYRATHHTWGMGRAAGNLGRIHRRLENYELALGYAAEAREFALLAGDPETLAGEWQASGLTYNRLGRYPIALEHLSNALKTYPDTPQAPAAKALILQGIGLVYENLGMYREAAAQLNSALDLLGDAEANALHRAGIRTSLGNIYGHLGDPGKARLHFESALKVFGPLGHAGSAALAELNLAMLDLQRDDLEGALGRYTTVERIARAGPDTQLLAQSLLGKTEVALRRGDAPHALEWAAEACAGGAAAPMRARCERAQGVALVQIDDLPAASERYKRAIGALEEMYSTLGDPSESAAEGLYGGFRHYYLEAVEVAMLLHAREPAAGHERRAFELSESAKSRIFQDQIRRTGFRAGGERDAELQALLTQERAALARVLHLTNIGRSAPTQERQATETARAEAADRLARIRARLRADYPAYRALEQPASAGIESIQATLGPEEALVSFALGPHRSVAFVFRRDSFSAVPLALGAQAIAERVSSLRLRLEPPARAESIAGMADSLVAFDPAEALELYQRVFAPVAPRLGGARRVFIAGDGALWLLPFSALVEPAYDPRRFGSDRATADGERVPLLHEYTKIPWLGRRYHFRYLPAAGSLVHLRADRDARPATWTTPLVAFADPVFLDEDAVPAMPGRHRRLRATAEEANAIAKRLGVPPGDIYLRAQASKANVYSARLAQARYVLFATHGFAGADYAGGAEPALVLAQTATQAPQDSMLTMSDILGLSLRAELAVLSACSTAGRPSRIERYGDGFAGIGRSFMHAGARAVLVTHWSIVDDISRDFVIAFFDADASKGTDAALAAAVKKTRLRIIRDDATGRNVALAHPAFWAAYALVGD